MTRGAHAHIEHPHRSAVCRDTPASVNLPGERTTFDQCEYGSTTTVDDAEVPITKTTSIQTTKRAMSRIVSERCSGNHQHARLEGGSSCKKAPSRPFINAELLQRAKVANPFRSTAFMRELLDSSGMVRTAMKRVAESTITSVPIFRLEDLSEGASGPI